MHALAAVSPRPLEGRLTLRPTPRDPDLALAERARAGDREAFGRLFERHAGFVHGILLARAPAREVPDLVQDAFAAALAAIGSLGDAARFAPWLATIARNLARDAQRSTRSRAPLEDDPVRPLPGVGRRSPAHRPSHPDRASASPRGSTRRARRRRRCRRGCPPPGRRTPTTTRSPRRRSRSPAGWCTSKIRAA